jgi:hypothetical protein
MDADDRQSGVRLLVKEGQLHFGEYSYPLATKNCPGF